MKFEVIIHDFERFKTEYNEVVAQGLAEYKTEKELFILCIQAEIEFEKRFKLDWDNPYRICRKKKDESMNDKTS